MNIYKYKNYRNLLSDFYERKKTETSGRFSYRMMTRLSGFKSPNYLKLVIDGKRNLSKASLLNITKLLGLEDKQAAYFEKLIEVELADASSEKNKIKTYIESVSAKELTKTLTTKSKEYLSNWWYPAIRELSLLDEFQLNAAWVASKIFPRITEEQAQKALNTLMDLNILQYDKTNEKWITCEGSLITDANQLSDPIKNIQKQYIQLASDSLQQFTHKEREVSSLTVALDEEGYIKAKKMINNFRFQMDVLLSQTKKPDSIYQLNLQFFPISTSDWILSEEQKKKALTT